MTPGSVTASSSPTPQPALGQKLPFLLQRHSDVVGRKPAVQGGNRGALGHTEQDKMASSQPGAGGTNYLVLH